MSFSNIVCIRPSKPLSVNVLISVLKLPQRNAKRSIDSRASQFVYSESDFASRTKAFTVVVTSASLPYIPKSPSSEHPAQGGCQWTELERPEILPMPFSVRGSALTMSEKNSLPKVSISRLTEKTRYATASQIPRRNAGSQNHCVEAFRAAQGTQRMETSTPCRKSR